MPARENISLALSGGGFRATLFHLGVIRFLYDANLLSRVSRICSVSGGSVLAAHLVLKWTRYTGNREDFNEAAKELINFAQRDVRGRIIRQWLAWWIFLIPQLLRFVPHIGARIRLNRTDLLKRQYAHLYKAAKLSDLGSGSEPIKKPDLQILATSLTTGFLCSFNKDGFWIVQNPKTGHAALLKMTGHEVGATTLSASHQDSSANELELEAIPMTTLRPKRGGRRNSRNTPVQKIAAETLSLSAAVAASSAFPALFPPEPLTADDFGFSEAQWLNEYLTDGGVFDNVGISMLQVLEPLEPSWQILVSDAGLGFDFVRGRRFGGIADRTVRMTEVVMNRAAQLQSSLAEQTLRTPEPIYVNIHDQIGQLDGIARRKVANIRTDFDAFSNAEIAALIRHGYSVAAERWSARQPVEYRPGSSAGWCGVPLRDDVSLGSAIARSYKRPLNLVARDFPTFFVLCALAFYACGIYFAAQRLADHSVLPFARKSVAAEGSLTTILRPYTGSGSLAEIPALQALVAKRPVPVSVYEFESQPIGVLTGGAPHRAAVVSLDFSATTGFDNALEYGSGYLFLKQGSSNADSERLVLLEEASERLQLKVPPGGPEDRIWGILVVPELRALSVMQSQLVRIRVETP